MSYEHFEKLTTYDESKSTTDINTTPMTKEVITDEMPFVEKRFILGIKDLIDRSAHIENKRLAQDRVDRLYITYEEKIASLQSTLDTMRQERDEVDKKLEDIRAMIKGYVIDLFHDDCDVPHNRQLIAMNIIELFGYDKKEAYDFLSRSPRTAQAETKKNVQCEHPRAFPPFNDMNDKGKMYCPDCKQSF